MLLFSQDTCFIFFHERRSLFHILTARTEKLPFYCLITDIIMEDNSLLRAKLDKKGVPEKEYYEIQTEKGYSKYQILHTVSTDSQ